MILTYSASLITLVLMTLVIYRRIRQNTDKDRIFLDRVRRRLREENQWAGFEGTVKDIPVEVDEVQGDG